MMATEIVTPYPLPPWPTQELFGDHMMQQILEKLDGIDQRLSRIEQEIVRNQPKGE